jgi:hypothetical protein
MKTRTARETPVGIPPNRVAKRGHGAVAPPTVRDVMRAPGKPLETSVREDMEPRLRHDFSKVRLHTDARAAESAEALGARAYTIGHTVVFAPGQFRPATSTARRLLAHELAHVAQQEEGRVAAPAGTGGPPVVARDPILEREAHAWGDRTSAGRAILAGGACVAHRSPAGSTQMAVQPADADQTPRIEKSDLDKASALVAEAPSTPDERATWLLEAHDMSFVTFTTGRQKEQVEGIRDKKKVEALDPAAKDYDVPILRVEVGLVKNAAQRWIDGGGSGAKPSIRFGSFIRTGSSSLHSKGRAIDINDLTQATSIDATVRILNDLDPSIHKSYEIGLPFQGDFFDPADEITSKRTAAEQAAARSAAARATERPNASARTSPQPAIVENALVKFSAHIYASTGTLAGGKWDWSDPRTAAGGAAHKLLKSQVLRDALDARRKDGLTFTIFPDNDDHLHLAWQ